MFENHLQVLLYTLLFVVVDRAGAGDDPDHPAILIENRRAARTASEIRGDRHAVHLPLLSVSVVNHVAGNKTVGKGVEPDYYTHLTL